jgi:hypothetical protein
VDHGGAEVTPPAVHVVWWTGHPEVAARTFWDQQVVIDLLQRSRHRLVEHDDIDRLPAGEGAVVIVPGRFQDGDATLLNAALKPLPWVVLIITSDEEATFPFGDLEHDQLVAWVQYPRPGLHDDARPLPLGPTTDTHGLDQVDEHLVDERPLDWFFAGQITHHRRVDAARAMLGQENGLLLASSRFAGGFDQPTYLAHLASAKVVLAPSGPVSPDSFRLWEALEAVALPIVDARASHYDPEGPYWTWLLADPPFSVVEDWDDAPEIVANALTGWPANATRAAAWWQARKRHMGHRLDADITAATGSSPRALRVSDLITVVLTTSPIPSHPGTGILDTTVESVRAQPELEHVELVVAADGIPPGLEHRQADYERFLHRLVWNAARGRLGPCLPLLAPGWRHQALTLAAALQEVQTPLVLVMEHDTPLVGEFDWDGLGKAVLSGRANLIRFHHESMVLEEHRYLMVDHEPEQVCGVHLLRTAQWSQRPHLASAEWYRELLGAYFSPASRTMVEDCLHGVLANAWDQEGEAGWDRFRLWMYAPGHDMKRSTHLDGRDGDPKGEMVFEYPGGGTPQWAPRAMSERRP